MAVGCRIPTIALQRRLCGCGFALARPRASVTRRPQFSRADVLGRDFIGGDKRRLGRSRRLGRALVSETRRHRGAPRHQACGARARGPSPATTWRHALGIQRPYPTLKHDPRDSHGIIRPKPLAPEGAPASALPGFPVLFAMCRYVPQPRFEFRRLFAVCPENSAIPNNGTHSLGKLWQRGDACTLVGQNPWSAKTPSRPRVGTPARRWCRQIRRNSTTPRRCRVSGPCAAPDR